MKINNIATICYSTSGGGAERATCMWVQSMLKQGKHVIWLYSASIGDRPIDHPSLSYIHLPLDEHRQDTLKDILLQNQIDFCYDINPDDVSLLDDIKTIKECGCIAGVADHSCFFYPLYTLRPAVYLKRTQALKQADIVTALSPENVAWFQADGVANVVCMPNYLTFDPDILNIDRGKVLDNELLFVGRLCEIKSPERILMVIHELKNIHGYEKIHLSLLGRFDNKEIESSLKELVTSLEIQENVTFHGEVKNVEDYFNTAKLLIMTSYMEGAPMVINEAKAYGIPTIMFELPYVPGTKEAEGVVSVPQDDISSMANAIKHCLEDPNYYENLSLAAVRSLKILSNKEIDKKWQSVFLQLENGKSIATQSGNKDKILNSTMNVVQLISHQINKKLDLQPLHDQCEAVKLDLERISKKNQKHLKNTRILLVYSIVVTIMLLSYIIWV